MFIRVRILVTVLLGVLAAPAQSVPIRDLQSYDPVSGAPTSTYLGQIVTIAGEVTIPDSTLAPDSYFVRDDTGGVMIRSANPAWGGGGFKLQVSGLVAVTNGEVFIEETEAVRWSPAGPTLARPIETDLDSVLSDLSRVGSLLRIRGVATSSDTLGFTLMAGSSSLRVEPSRFPAAWSGHVQDGDMVAVSGPIRLAAGQLRIVPRDSLDLFVSPPERPYLLKSDGSGSFPDLATALAFAVDGDTISLGAGVYPVHDLLMPRDITLRGSAAHPDSVILDANEQGRLFRFANGPASYLLGMTMRAGKSDWGGAIWCTYDLGNISTIESCIVENNSAPNGGGVASFGASPIFINCIFRNNTATRGGGAYLDLISSKQAITTPLQAPTAEKALSKPTFTDCLFEGNLADRGGALHLNGYDAVVDFTNCGFMSNTATIQGGSVFLTEGTAPHFDFCTFADNYAQGEGDAFYFDDAGYHGPVLISNCTIAFNGNAGSSLLSGPPTALAIENSIVSFNAGAQILVADHPDLSITCSNIYGNAAGDWLSPLGNFALVNENFSANPLFCEQGSHNLILAANSPCLPGNHPTGADCGLLGAVGDTTCTSMADQVVGVEVISESATAVQPGNILNLSVRLLNSSESLTMETGTRPTASSLAGLGELAALRLQPDFSWSSAYTAGLGEGIDTLVVCDPEAQVTPCDTLLLQITRSAIINSIEDIPNDQGRQVRIRWRADTRDSLSSGEPIVQYVVWRRVDDPPVASGYLVLAPDKLGTKFLADKAAPWLLNMAQALWEPVGPPVPGMMWDEYSSVVPTLADSTAAGPAFSTYFVSAHTTQPQVFYSSPPDSGFSVDNIAPAAPSHVTTVITADELEIRWDPNFDPDFQTFRIYRGMAIDFQVSDINLIGTTTAPFWSGSTGSTFLYRIAARDFAGNESASVLVDVVSAAPESFPARWQLHNNAPNPFNPSTTIEFEMPAAGTVDLRIYDLRGRIVRTLLSAQHLLPGQHQYTWDGQDNARQAVASGVYLLRIQSGEWSATGRMTLAR